MPALDAKFVSTRGEVCLESWMHHTSRLTRMRAAMARVPWNKGGRNSKLHAVVDESGKAFSIMLGPGNDHGSIHSQQTPGDVSGCMVLADKAYDSNKLRKHIPDSGGIANIPNKKNRKRPCPCDKEAARIRHLEENFFCRIKRFGRVNTRYDELAEAYMGFVTLPCLADWFRS